MTMNNYIFACLPVDNFEIVNPQFIKKQKPKKKINLIISNYTSD